MLKVTSPRVWNSTDTSRHEETPEEWKWNLKIKGGPEGEESEFGNHHFQLPCRILGMNINHLASSGEASKFSKQEPKLCTPKCTIQPISLPQKKVKFTVLFFLMFVKCTQSRIIPGNESTWPSSWQDGAKLTCCLKRWFRRKKTHLIQSTPPPPPLFRC